MGDILVVTLRWTSSRQKKLSLSLSTSFTIIVFFPFDSTPRDVHDQVNNDRVMALLDEPCFFLFLVMTIFYTISNINLTQN